MMKKIYLLAIMIGVTVSLTQSTNAMQAPYVDAFIDYESFLAGVDYYLGDTYYFESSEINVHEDYYVSYQIEHYAYNRKTFNQGGSPVIIYQSKDKNDDFYFELHLNIKFGPETMTVYPNVNNKQSAMSGENNSSVEIRVLNEVILPISEIERIFGLICGIYDKTMVTESWET